MASKGKLAGSVAIVTAAGQGLGEAIAKVFAREGASVAIVDINAQELKRVAGEIEAAGGSALIIPKDVTRSREVEEMVKTVLDRWGTVDILVNAAGGFHQFAPITEILEEEWDRVITLNLKTAFLCTRAVAKTMMDKKKGHIISIASGAGVAPNPYAPSFGLDPARALGARVGADPAATSPLPPVDGLPLNPTRDVGRTSRRPARCLPAQPARDNLRPPVEQPGSLPRVRRTAGTRL